MEYEQPQRNPADVQSSSLPPELITEILIRLPVKTLLQFRSVSKSWLALISSPRFVKAHLVKNRGYIHQKLMSTCYRRTMNTIIRVCSIRSLHFESVTESSDLDCPLKRLVMIVGSVNGLVCLNFKEQIFYIWNPSIRKLKKLADLEVAPIFGRFRFGFGYDELHDDYKLVTIFCDVKVEMYSLKSDSWRKMDDFQVGEVDTFLPTLVNSKLHWLTKAGGILYIDLTDEKWGKLEHPLYGERDDCLELGMLRSDLSMFRCYERMTCVDVWVMKEYGIKESWEKIYTIKFPYCIGNWWSPIFGMSNKAMRKININILHDSISIFHDGPYVEIIGKVGSHHVSYHDRVRCNIPATQATIRNQMSRQCLCNI
ncbi:hypothetical protein HAX54_027085 [Datura stramonium]|uniref:F-box domain-containing protein n=1 Tax=Datura stramonium TaxID=4076 RepID=A0ABS8V232_DATST|nr:hypothetical protein [Datura stramonium]